MNTEMVQIPGPSGSLEVAIDLPRTKIKPVTLIFCHPHPLYGGTMDNKVVVSAAKALLELGVKVVRFNFRGVGKSEGVYGEGEGEVQDCLAVTDWAMRQWPTDQFWIGGFSFGGYVAYRVANLRPFTQLLTIAPGMTLFDMSAQKEPEIPWTVIHSDQDEVVDPQRVFTWLLAHQCPFRLLKFHGASHFFHGRLVELRQLLKDNFQAFAGPACHS